MGIETSDTSVFEGLIQANAGAIKILAEGDSWFAYPRRFLLFGKDSNIIDHLADKPNLIILNTSRSGDELADMMSGEQKFSFLKRLSHIDFDIVLFSGGGNDIVGRYDFGFLLKEKQPGMTWQDCINEERLNLKLAQVELVYRELMERTIEIKPEMKVVTHTYDYAVPSSQGFELFDLIPIGKSWMFPYFNDKKILDLDDQKNIIKHILNRFKEKLIEVENVYSNNLKVVDTQGLLTDQEWRNEIHPTPEGFEKIAEKIYTEGIAV